MFSRATALSEKSLIFDGKGSRGFACEAVGVDVPALSYLGESLGALREAYVPGYLVPTPFPKGAVCR